LKVLHICPGYFGTKLYENLFSSLQEAKVKNEVFTLPFKNIKHNEENSKNLKVFDKKFNFFDRIIFFGKQHIIYKEICKEYSVNEVTIVHAHTLFSAGFSAYLLNKEFGVPYVATIRNTDINFFYKYMFHLRGVGRTILNNAQHIIFLSPAYRDFIIDKLVAKKKRQMILDKSVVIPNGIDKYFLDNKFIAKRAINNKLIKLIYIGGIDSNKNIKTTIKACKLLIDKGYSVSYTIVGKIFNIKFYKIIAKYRFIDYHPECSKEEVISYFRNSDIFIMPSVQESFGLVYAEAMSQGIPIIYSKGQGFDGQFDNGVVGYAVNCFDYRGISDKIIDIYNNYQQFSELCVSLVDKFNWLSIAQEYKNIYGLPTPG
jgi:glycosyltransferase involved in cell wall biosynthesis